MKQLCKAIHTVILLAFLLLAGNFAYATFEKMPDSLAMDRARISCIMHDDNGEIYTLYIIGEEEKFIGASPYPGWRKTEHDQVYKALEYNAYLTAPNTNSTLIQHVNLFGGDANQPKRLNLTDPTYLGGVYLIPGIDGQPDILVTAVQRYANDVDYRFFAIKNGELRPMKLMYKNQTLSAKKIGTHEIAYGLDDGTIAIPGFRRGIPGKVRSGNFVSVFMPDFTNMILIYSYTIDG